MRKLLGSFSFFSFLDRASSVLIVALALLIGGIILKKEFFDVRSRPTLNSEQDPAVGTRLAFVGKTVDWSTHKATLVLALSERCRFCTESAPFYKHLSQEVQRRPDIGLIAVFRQPRENSESYLEKLGVKIPQILEYPIGMLGVTSTPTILLVDHDGTIKRVWTGKLSPLKEKEVIAEL